MFKFINNQKNTNYDNPTHSIPHTVVLLETLVSQVKYTPTEYAVEITNEMTANGELPDAESVCLLAVDMILVQIVTDMLSQIEHRVGSMADKLNVSNYELQHITFPNWPARAQLLSNSVTVWFYAGLISSRNRDDVLYSIDSLLRFGPYGVSRQQKMINAYIHKQQYDYDRYVLLT